MRKMRHLLLKTSKRRALIRTIRPTREPFQGKFNASAPTPETKVIPIQSFSNRGLVLSFTRAKGDEPPSPEKQVRIIRLLTSYPQMA